MREKRREMEDRGMSKTTVGYIDTPKQLKKNGKERRCGEMIGSRGKVITEERKQYTIFRNTFSWKTWPRGNAQLVHSVLFCSELGNELAHLEGVKG